MQEWKFPDDPSQLTPELLTAAMAVDRPGLVVREVEVVETIACESGFASTADRVVLDLAYAPGAASADLPKRVILKTMLVAPHAPAVMYETEVRFYREIRPGVPFEAPQFYAGLFDAKTGQFGIVMEDLRECDAVFGNVTLSISLAQVHSLIRNLAALHAKYWESPALKQELGWLATPAGGGMSDFFQQVLPLIEGHLRTDPWRNEILAAIGRPVKQLFADMLAIQAGPLESGPRTLLHGDTHLGNTYLLTGNETGLLDFQLAMQGCYSRDLTYILTTALTIEQRRRHERELIAFYLQELRRGGVANVPDMNQAWQLHRLSAYWGLVIGWLTCPTPNYGREITEENLRRLTAAMIDLESVAAFG
ncbi:MAG: phosphotransferase [Myxococcota bacterium]|jgi:hypothetical protein|nr:phosphotransferase [bacterium]MDP7075080.1 phosphotransferase [Myxococcota bacterium]MDP7299859.1 phosphotransferase [Myxococcota bacterium]MDP7432524.1 phosphotransferase [Myxococcota bacterium]HJO24542.1 phosphotransferase [Myxococcota bacterium]